MEINIQAIHFDADQKLEDFIKEKVTKLTQYYDNILLATVYLKVDKAQAVDNKIAEIKLSIPGKDLFAEKQSSSFEESTVEAVDALRRQILKHKGKMAV